MSRSSRRGPWLPEEDAALLHLVRTQGPNNWVRISQHMQHRSPKQCRERFHQNLKPSLNHEPISAEEGELIEQLVQEMGKRWAEIARRLGNRSDNAVKNWWNGSMNRRKRTDLQQGGGSRMVQYRTLPMPTSASAHQLYTHELPMPLQEAIRYPSSTPPLPFHRPEAQQSSYSLTETRSLAPENHHAGKARTEQNTVRRPTRFESTSYSLSEHVQNDRSQFRPSPLSPCPTLESMLPNRPLPTTSHSTNHAEWQLPPIHSIEVPARSPAPTDSSYASPNQQAPSLVSDDQSTCSTSPKTAPSPRSGIPVPHEPTMPMWLQVPPNTIAGAHQNERLGRTIEIRDSNERTTPTLAATKPRQANLPVRPHLPHSYSLPGVLAFSSRSASLENSRPGRESRETATGTAKDTRMNVSSLLG